MLARLFVTKYLVSNDFDDKERALLEFANIKSRAQELIDKIQNPQRISLYQSFERSFSLYQTAFINVSEVIEKKEMF